MASEAMQARSNARMAAVQALYQMEAAGAGVDGVIHQFRTHRLSGDIEAQPRDDTDDDFFAELLRGVIRLQDKIDPLIEARLANRWTLARLDATARAILRAATYELVERTDINAPVVIDEYLDIAAAFFSGEDRSFINAVLDRVARDARGETRRVARP